MTGREGPQRTGDGKDEKQFFFVDGFQANAQAKRRMRRHVMLGKNVGKTFQRRSRLERQASSVHQVSGAASSRLGTQSQVSSQEDAHGIIRDGRGPDDHAQLGTSMVLRALGIPHFVSADSYAVVDQFFDNTAARLYPVQLGLSLEAAKLVWLQILLSDQVSFECSLAMFRASNEILLGKGESSSTALYYTGRTLELVKQKLESNEALSDSTIGIVLSLITQEQMRQQHTAAEVHMRGLARLIELRGGIGKLEGSVSLVNKIYKYAHLVDSSYRMWNSIKGLTRSCRTDIVYAIQTGCSPLFYLDKVPLLLQDSSMEQLGLKRDEIPTHEKLNQLDPSLRNIWTDIMTASLVLGRLADIGTLDLAMYHEIALSLAYRLLRFRTLGEARVTLDQQSAHHMALVVFMMTVFMQHTQRRILQLHMAVKCLDVIFHNVIRQDDDDSFVFWFAVIAYMWISGEKDEEWLLQIIRERGRRLGLLSWESARNAVEGYPWVDQIHNSSARAVWALAYQKEVL